MTDKTEPTPAQPMSAREYRLTRKSPAHRSDTIDEFAEAYAAHVLSTYQGIRDRLETSLRQPDLTEWMKTAAQESADDIIAAMLRIRLSREDVTQLILFRLTAAYEATQKEKQS